MLKKLLSVLMCLTLLTTGLLSNVVAKDKKNVNRYNVMIVLDNSKSMKYTDPNGLRFEAINMFVNLLAETDNYLGSITFAKNAKEITKLTEVDTKDKKDDVFTKLKAQPLDGFTNIGNALNTAVTTLSENGDPELPSVILFLSDGNTEMPSEKELQKSLDEKADAIQTARENKTKIYSICLNSNAEADTKEMKQISKATDGRFKEVVNPKNIQTELETFYNFIFDGEGIEGPSGTIPDNGVFKSSFFVPYVGIEEVNVLIYGDTKSNTLFSPDGKEYKNVTETKSKTFTLLKILDVVPGQWKLITKGDPGNKIQIKFINNNRLGIKVQNDPSDSFINPKDFMKFKVTLMDLDKEVTVKNACKGFNAELRITDAYGKNIDTVKMQNKSSYFECKYQFKEGTYYYTLNVNGNGINKTTKKYGPIKSSKKALTEAEKNNTKPTAVEEKVKDTVYIIPFVGGSYSIDLKTLAKDKQDKKLVYQIVSSSFIEGDDYQVDSNYVLTQDEFSLRKGSYIVRAIDSGGLYCDIELVVSTINVGVVTLIILAIILILVLFSLWYIFNRRFRGTITVNDGTTGGYDPVSLSPKRGKCRLSLFNLEPNGLDLSKSYFIPTGKSYIYLHTNKPVKSNGKKGKKIKILSNQKIRVNIDDSGIKYFEVIFESKIRNSSKKKHFK